MRVSFRMNLWGKTKKPGSDRSLPGTEQKSAVPPRLGAVSTPPLPRTIIRARGITAAQAVTHYLPSGFLRPLGSPFPRRSPAALAPCGPLSERVADGVLLFRIGLKYCLQYTPAVCVCQERIFVHQRARRNSGFRPLPRRPASICASMAGMSALRVPFRDR